MLLPWNPNTVEETSAAWVRGEICAEDFTSSAAQYSKNRALEAGIDSLNVKQRPLCVL